MSSLFSDNVRAYTTGWREFHHLVYIVLYPAVTAFDSTKLDAVWQGRHHVHVYRSLTLRTRR